MQLADFLKAPIGRPWGKRFWAAAEREGGCSAHTVYDNLASCPPAVHNVLCHFHPDINPDARDSYLTQQLPRLPPYLHAAAFQSLLKPENGTKSGQISIYNDQDAKRLLLLAAALPLPQAHQLDIKFHAKDVQLSPITASVESLLAAARSQQPDLQLRSLVAIVEPDAHDTVRAILQTIRRSELRIRIEGTCASRSAWRRQLCSFREMASSTKCKLDYDVKVKMPMHYMTLEVPPSITHLEFERTKATLEDCDGEGPDGGYELMVLGCRVCGALQPQDTAEPVTVLQPAGLDLRGLPQLQELVIEDGNNPDYDVWPFTVAEELRRVPALNWLVLSEAPHGAAGVAAQLPCLTRLEYLQVDFSGWQELAALGNTLGCLHLLQQLILSLDGDAYTALPRVRQRQHMHAVGAQIAKLSRLEGLWLHHVPLGAGGMRALAAGVSQMACLSELMLNDNRADNEACCALARALAHIRGLRRCDIVQNCMGDEACVLLAAALKAQSQPTALNLHDNNIGYKGCCAIWHAKVRLPKLWVRSLFCNPCERLWAEKALPSLQRMRERMQREARGGAL